jgi:hypothetical protein
MKIVKKLSTPSDTSNYSPNFSSTWQYQAIWCLLWCFWYWFDMCTYARQSGYCLCFTSTSAPWKELPNTWSWVSSCHSRSQDLEALPYGHPLQYLYRS